ncbi:TetR/AcrR family transcriptional regulator [Tatumella sp. UBA2305]|uniref:TetR/AcrR family transcriptional regulator n=1 Tax=Tatumella sp. UBA2305 TaxID=1947647 RepID=UPI0025F71794|nr:TetR/AcrR family transcriptional regulator [Tatumella sp. UBA2305]
MNKPDDQLIKRRREQIIFSASQCFSRTGFHGTSMADIIQQSGLSAGQIYRHYSGKSLIINECVRYITERWCAFLLKKLPEETRTDNIIDINSAFWNEWPEEQRRLLIETYSEVSRNSNIRQVVNSAEQKLISDLDEKLSVIFPESSPPSRRQKILLLLLLTDGVICRRFADDSLNKKEMIRINSIFSHHMNSHFHDKVSD